ncbi:hypothetical protein QFC22_006323 [Naganishia vaughanmartiniae]|uniref:Uncharacterized protein n=1 Tax=Naganishia vaughanmartiniae TaxID=1424756 RepID=A0ACC2WKG8_9TREE|nr:hypothetical protein QFC22_006323 [Naganishia vaughanmartiniae]
MQGEKCDYHSSFNPTSTGTVNEEHVWPKRSISVSFNGKTVLGNRSSDHNERTKSELSNDEGIVKEGGLCSHLRRSRLGDGATTSNNSSQVKKERNPARLQRFKEKFRQRGQKAKQLLDYFEDKDQSESPWDPSLKKNSTVDVRNAGTKSTIPSSSHREGTPADYQKSTALAPPRLMYHVPPAHVYEGLAQLTLTLEEGVAKKRREAQIAAMERRREEQLKELAKFDFGLPGVSNKRL